MIECLYLRKETTTYVEYEFFSVPSHLEKSQSKLLFHQYIIKQSTGSPGTFLKKLCLIGDDNCSSKWTLGILMIKKIPDSTREMIYNKVRQTTIEIP